MQCKFLQIITSDKFINVNTIYREETDMTKYISKMYLFSLQLPCNMWVKLTCKYQNHNRNFVRTFHRTSVCRHTSNMHVNDPK